jgi:enoyl-CoA hydratase/carnithine racemase
MTPFTGSSSPTGEWKHFDFDVSDDGVATVTFDRPDKLNALTFEVYADLRDLLQELPQRTDVRVLVITGRGRGFCSGGDVHAIIGELLQMGPSDLLDFTRMTGTVVRNMRECPVPIVAAINGVAAGAGAVIALAADFRVFAASGSLAFLFTKVGLAGADMGSAYLLPRLVGLSKATELLILGDAVDAAAAAELGLAYRVVEDGALAATTAELAARIAEGPTLAYARTKSLITRELDMDLNGALELEAVTQALLMTSADHAEFYAAFNEGRAPRWSGR